MFGNLRLVLELWGAAKRVVIIWETFINSKKGFPESAFRKPFCHPDFQDARRSSKLGLIINKKVPATPCG